MLQINNYNNNNNNNKDKQHGKLEGSLTRFINGSQCINIYV